MKNLYLFLVILATAMLACNSSTGDKTSNTTDTTIATLVSPVANDTTTALSDTVKITRTYHNITILRTTDASGDADQKDEYEYKDSNLVSQTDKLYAQVGTFGTAERIWLAPRGWTGYGGLYTNGGVSVRLYPAGGNDSAGARIMYTMETSPASVNNDAAPFFPKAMEEHEEVYDYLHVAKLPEGTKLKRISSKLVTYTMPAEGGLLTQGVVFYGSDSPDDDPYFREVRVILPAGQIAVMDYLVKWYTEKLK